MKAVYKIDISSHIARPVGVYDLAAFDAIVALDASIYHHLRDIWEVPETVLYGWDIEDPLGSDYQTYRETALKIERRLEQFLAALGL
jgi:protein-tyrosine-phosphatase